MEEDGEETGFLYPKIENVYFGLNNIKSEPVDHDENDYDAAIELAEYDSDNYYAPIPNKIILGSKPTPQTVEPVAGTSTASNNWETFPCDDYDDVLTSPNDLDDKTTNSLLVKRSMSIKRSKSISSSNSCIDDAVSDASKRRIAVKSTAKSWNNWQSFPCEKCDVVLQSQRELKAHKKSHYTQVGSSQDHGQSCSKSFMEDSIPESRRRQKAVKSTTKSSILNHTFPLAKSAKVDNVRASVSDNSDRLLCNHCDETFPDEIALMTHTYELLPEKTFKCDICELGFNTNVGLRGHRPVHFRKNQTKTNRSVVDRTSDFFQCPICTCYLKFPSGIINHMSSSHNSEYVEAKPVKFKGKCAYCPKTLFNHRLYDMHILKYHPEEFNYKPSLKTVFKNVMKYKCKLCKQVFTTRYAAAKHKALNHPTYKQKTTFETIMPVDRETASTSKPPKPRQMTSLSKNLLLVGAPIPLQTLFKCNKCQIHFVTCSTALEHSKRCVLAKGDWKCSKCRRSFTHLERPIHTLQHEHSDKFKVHIVNDKILSKVICCCPKCELLFDENSFWKHVSAGCKSVSGVDCDTCNFNMHPDALSKHQRYHSKYGLSQADFIVIEFVDAGVQANSSNPNEDGKQKLYYCKVCNTNFYTTKYKTFHLSAMCTDKIDTKNCLTCGLLFSFKVYTKHMLDHTEKNYTLDDYTFMRIQDDKMINPPVPEFKKCETCKVRFISLLQKKVHDCETQQYMKCLKCSNKYESSVYDIHKRFHEYRSLKDENNDESNEIYIYACVSCNYGFITFDGLVEHCQNHYNNTQGLKTTPCNFCKLGFAEEHVVNHRYVKILKFNHEKLLNGDFLVGFKRLSSEQTKYVLCKSMYGKTSSMRHVRLRLELDGPPERSLYKCAQCNLCFDINDVSEHTQSPCQNSPTYSCSSCTSEFPTKSTAAKHNKIHVRFGDDITFREIVFNEPSDTELMETLRTGRKIESLKFRKCQQCELLIKKNEYQSHMESHNKIETVGNRSLKYTIYPSDKPEKMYTTYRCMDCDADIMQKRNILRHNCNSKFKSLKCKKCSLSVRTFFKNKHEQFHVNLPKFVTNNIRILKFELHHDGSIDDWVKDVSAVTPKNKRKTYDTRKTGDMSYARNESDSGEEDDDNAPLIDKTPSADQAVNELIKWKLDNRNKMYQCQICYMCFLKKQLLFAHFSVCNDSTETPFTCDRCDITFHPSLVAFNDKLHDLIPSHSNDNYIYLISISLANNSETWLYRCKTCDVHYLSYNALWHHFTQNHKSTLPYVECEICNLKFSTHTRTKHMNLHDTHVGNDNLFNIESIERIYIEPTSGVNSVKDQTSVVGVDEEYENESQNTDISVGNEQSTSLSVYNENEAANSVAAEARSSSNRPPYVLYKCISCNVHYINRQTLLCHMRNKTRIHRTDSIQCDICNIEFGLYTMKKHKILHHKNDKHSDFVIDTITENIFYDDLNALDEKVDDTQSESENGAELDDIEYNDDDVEKTQPSSVDPDDLAPSALGNDPSALGNEMVKIRLYQCKDCRICVEKSQRAFHVCCSDLQKKRCIKCSLAFKRNDITQHMRLHRKHPELSRKNYVLVKFGQRSVKSKIYKCVVCSTHFVSIQTLQWHIDVHNHQTKRDYCEICGLFFGKLSLSRHVYIHHTKLKLTTDKFDIVYVSTDTKRVAFEDKSTETNLIPNATDASKKLPKSYKKLYKCFECDLYFLTQTGYYKHMYNHAELDPTEFIACKMCDMQFLTEDLGAHMKTHRDKSFTLENLMIEGYQSANGSPRIESYLAVDGLNSKIVSTTTPFDNDEYGIKIDQLSTVDSTSAKLQ